MRFYDLRITDPASGNTTLRYTNYPNGQYDPGALNVAFNLYVYPQASPMGNSTITVEGVPQDILGNARQFTNQYLQLRGGMGAGGLPLANPSQAGLLVQGNVYQAFGNWTGTQVDIDFVVTPSAYTIAAPGNIVLNWPAGMPLATALQGALKTAYPNATVTINISNIVLSHDEHHACSTLTGLAQMLGEITTTNLTIAANGNTITVSDTSYQPAAKQLVFTDIIGQPMWIDSNIIQVRTVLRADIQVADTIKMPSGFANAPGFVQTTAASMPSQINYKMAVQGSFTVQSIRHIGNLRQPNGNAWCTVINAAAIGQ